MRRTTRTNRPARRALAWLPAAAALLALTLPSRPAAAIEYFLRADVTQKVMPDGRVVPMWGFALDSAFGAHDGEVTVPGPQLVVPRDQGVLDIQLENRLPVPISIIVPGQRSRTRPRPVRLADGRARSLTYETPPGNTTPVRYSFAFRHGSFIYHSATHMAVQVPMGLYGPAVRERIEGRRAYPRTPTYQSQALLFYSEIDPDLHDEVVAGEPPTPSRETPVAYTPRYFLVNGEPFRADADFDPEIVLGAPGQRALLRFFNASLRTRVPLLQGLHMNVIAEDGFALRYPREQYTVVLPPLKTTDAIVWPKEAGVFPLYDRRLALVNGVEGPGGMLRYLTVGHSVRGGGPGGGALRATPETARRKLIWRPGPVSRKALQTRTR